MKAIELSHITTRYQQATVDDSKIFYREAGPTNPHQPYFCCTAFPPRRTCSAT